MLARLIMNPPGAAGPLKPRVPTHELIPAIVVGLRVNVVNTGGFTINVDDWAVLFNDAVMVAVACAATLVVLIGNVADD